MHSYILTGKAALEWSLDNASFVVNLAGDAASKLRQWSSIIGIVTAIVGNIFISFALNLQRYAHIRLNRERQKQNKPWKRAKRKGGRRSYGTQQQSDYAEERARINRNAPALNEQDLEHRKLYHDNNGSPGSPQSQRSRSSSGSTIRPSEKDTEPTNAKTYLSSPYWWAGILLMTTGEAGNFLAYGFAPASIVSPLGVVALVSNCVIAPCLLHERFRQRDFWGVVVAVAGAVVVVLSAKTSETKMGPSDLWGAIKRWEFILYLSITAATSAVLVWASGKYGQRTILIDLGLVALFGGYTALSTKGVASLLSATLWRAFTFPVTYILVVILIVSALLQIRYINRALQRFDSTQVIPTQFVLFTLSVIVGSAILYRDFESATVDRVGKFVGGCVLTFLGVYLITSGRSRDDDDEGGEETEDEEEAIGLVDEERHEDHTKEIRDINIYSQRDSTASVTFNEEELSSKYARRPSQQQSRQQSSTSQTPQRPSIRSSEQSRKASAFDEAVSPLTENPWLSPNDRLAPIVARRPLETTISSPLLPSEARDSRPSTPQNRRHPSIPKIDRPSALSRRSMSRMVPGPIWSPLSSPLSAIVADSMRRDADSPTRPRRRLSGPSRTRSQRATRESSSGEGVIGTLPLRNVEQLPEQVVEHQRPGDGLRSQSYSATLGSFFRLKAARSKGKDTDTEHTSAESDDRR